MTNPALDTTVEQLIAEAAPAQTLRLLPGDVLVLRFTRKLRLMEAETIDRTLRGWLRRQGFAGVTPLVLDEGADIAVLMKERKAAFVR